MVDRTPDATPTVDLGPGGDRPEDTDPEVREASAFDPPRERFETRSEIGRGGMGRVDDAFDRGLGRPVAIKHMLSASSVDLARFEREARITARLEHPGIVPIHDAGRTREGTPYYVMRRVDGQPLDQRVTGTLAERLALIPNVLAACDAVGFAHARGVVHRDIKPTNILVGPFGETLVIDWGLARETAEADDASSAVPSTDRDLTRAGTVAGTPGFMAPEQARGEAVDARADVFALGATLYYVLAGQPPYGAISATEMIDLAGAGRSPDWRALPADTPPELRAIATKAMASDAAQRYADASALAADLRRFITGNLVGAYEYSPLAKLVRFVRRHRAAMAVAAISAIVVIVGAVVSVRRVLAERDDANAARAIAEQRQRDTKSVNDRLLVQHALDLAADDPIATISALRTLTRDSPRWREARVAALAAWVNGIPFGFNTYDDVERVEISGDSRRAFVLAHSGYLDILDLEARTHVQLARLPGQRGAAWLGARHVVVPVDDHVVVIDVITRAQRVWPIEVRNVWSNRTTHAWLEATDHRVFEISDPAAEPKELAKDVTYVQTSFDEEMLIQRGNVIELVTPERRFTVPVPNPSHERLQIVAAIRDGRLIVLTNSVAYMWHVDGDRLVDDGTFASPRNDPILAVHIVADKFVITRLSGIGYLDRASGWHRLAPGHGIVASTPRGLSSISDNGYLNVYDDHGWFSFGRHAAALRRADVSTDGRFVIASTESRGVLVWDIAAMRPRQISTTVAKRFVRLTDHYLWFDSSTEGFSRVDLATGKEEQLEDAFVAQNTAVDPDEQFAAVSRFNGDIVVFDFSRPQVRRLELAAVMHNSYPGGIVFSRADNTIWTWKVGADAAQRVGSFDAKTPVVGITMASGSSVLGVFADHVERLDLATSRTEHAQLANVDSYGSEASGRVWLHAINNGVWWWDPGQPLHKPLLPFVPDGLRIDGDDVALYSHEAIALVFHGKQHVVSHASSQFAWAGNNQVATLSATGEVDVIDMATELVFRMPDRHVDRLAAYNGHIALGTETGVALWSLPVPEEPAALYRWLQTVTNAEPIANSDAYRWP